MSSSVSWIDRRDFMTAVGAALAVGAWNRRAAAAEPISEIQPDEDVFSYVRRVKGSLDAAIYKQILGAANEFKEGDAIVGVAAADEPSRENARRLLANTRVGELDEHPPLRDRLYELTEQNRDAQAAKFTSRLTLAELKQF